jgi:hypothetical protein
MIMGYNTLNRKLAGIADNYPLYTGTDKEFAMSSSNHTSNKSQFKSPEEITPNDIERFWNKVDRRSDDECWEWQAGHNGRYGLFTIRHRKYYAHRIAYRITHGVVSDLVVCHHCDNPRCVNPAHLFAGTQSDNLRDAIKKGRMHPPKSPQTQPTMRGENHPEAKLSNADVRQIRKLLKAGKLTQQEIGNQFGVSASNISLIKLGKKWQYLD